MAMVPHLTLVLLLACCACAQRQPAGFPPLPLQRRAAAAAIPVLPGPAPPTLTISPITLGADATGVADSTAALAAALAAGKALAANNSLPAAAGSGGVLIDLAGGTYRVTAPLLLRGANGVRLAGGTLVAGAGFPATGCLLDIEGGGNLVLEDLTLDSNHTGCGLRVDSVVQVTLARTFFLHYSSFGVWGDDSHGASHELMVSECFFAEYMWGERGFDTLALQNGTAIYLAPQFYDSNFYHSIIRCTRTGIVNLAGANLWHGMHIYSTCNKDPSGGNVSVGLLNAAWGQTRIASSYFDDSPLVVVSASDITVKDNLVYGLSALIFAPHAGSQAGGAFVSGNVFTATPYSGAGPGLHYDASQGAYPLPLQGVVVAENGGSASARAPLRATRATASVLVTGNSSSASASADLDLRQHLLFLQPNASSSSSGFDWRSAAAPVWGAVRRHLEAMQAGAGLQGQQRVAAAAPPLGSALAQVAAATPVLLGAVDAGGSALQTLGCYAAAAQVALGSAPGLLQVAVQLLGLGPAQAAQGCAPLEQVAQWRALVSVSVDQAAASVQVGYV